MLSNKLPIPAREGIKYHLGVFLYEDIYARVSSLGGGSIGPHQLIKLDIIEDGLRVTKPKDPKIAEQFGYNMVALYDGLEATIERLPTIEEINQATQERRRNKSKKSEPQQNPFDNIFKR